LLSNDTLWDDNLVNLTPLPIEQRVLERELRAELGTPDPRYLVLVTAPDREQVLQKSERIARVLEAAIAANAVARYELAAHILPSRRMQEQRLAALPEAPALASNLDKAAQDLPFKPGVFAPFLADVANARTKGLLELETVRRTAFGAKVDALLFPVASGWAAIAPVSGVSDAKMLETSMRKDTEPGVQLLDLKAEADALVSGYRAEALKLSAIGLLGIAALVYAGLRSLTATARILAPVLAAALMDMATLSLLGVQLTLFHLVSLLLVVGVGTNYALFFNRPHSGDEDQGLLLLSLGVASAATLISALALAFSGTPVLRAIGMTTAVGTLYALILSALMAPRATGHA
jgi:predicted exporter